MFCVLALPQLALQPALGRRAVMQRSAAALGLLPAIPAFAEAEPFTGAYAKQKPGSYGMSTPADLGSAGISSYEKMKLETNLKELAEPAATAGPELKGILDTLTAELNLVKESQPATKLEQAADALAAAASSESLRTQGEAIAKLAVAAAKKDDSRYKAAITLAEKLTDFAYEAAATDKPQAQLREAPPVYDPNKKRIDLPVSGKTI